MISWRAPFLQIRGCEVFISVIVTHPSFVRCESIRAHEKWLTAVMSVSPPSANHASSSPRNTDSPFIPLQCFPSTSYTFLPSHFHVPNLLFSVEAALILVNRTGPGHRISYTWDGGGCRCRIAARPMGDRNWDTKYFNYTSPHIPALNALHIMWKILKKARFSFPEAQLRGN